MAAKLKLPNFKDDALNRAFDAVSKATSDLQSAPFSGGVSYVLDETLASGANVVSHKLGRKPQGLFVTSRTALYDVQFDRRATTTNDRTAVLNAAGAVVCDLVWW